MEASISVNYLKINYATEKEFILILKATFTLVYGTMINFMEKESICIAMDKYMMEKSNSVSWKVKVFTTMTTAMHIIMETGIGISNMEKDYILVQNKYIKDSGKKDNVRVMHFMITN